MPRGGVIAELGVRPPELFLLFTLRRAAREAGTGINPSDLAARLEVTPGHVTQLITALEAQGMVGREVDPSDRRRVLVSLTARGAAALEEASARYVETYRGLAAHLGPADSAALISLLERANEYFTRTGGPEGQPCHHGIITHGRSD